MFLRCLKFAGIRNLAAQTVVPGAGVNLLVGGNGAGKTSLLEAVFLLARGRSFRTQALDTVVSRGATNCSVYGELVIDSHGGTEVVRRLGVSRETGGGFSYRLDGAAVNAASTLADTLPLLLINSDSLGLLGGSPKARRHFLDWGLFHTRPAARQLWRNHLRAHRQRNALLRHGTGLDRRELDLWDRRFSESGELITTMRRGYMGEIAPIAAQFTDTLSPGLGNLELSFQTGWDRDQSLAEALKLHRDRDIMLRATQSGPHRADLKVRLNGRLAAESLSRGQSKVLALAMLLAQGAHFLQRRGRSCLNLIDDLPAELDQSHRRRVARLMTEIGGQSFVTGTDVAQMGADWIDVSAAPAVKMFHVEQGRFIESPR